MFVPCSLKKKEEKKEEGKNERAQGGSGTTKVGSVKKQKFREVLPGDESSRCSNLRREVS